MSKNIKLILGILVGLCLTEQLFGAQQQPLAAAGMAFLAVPVVAPVAVPQNGPAQPPVLQRKRKAPLQLLPQHQVALVIPPLSTPRGSDAWCVEIKSILEDKIYQFISVSQAELGLKFILSELRVLNNQLNSIALVGAERQRLQRAKDWLMDLWEFDLNEDVEILSAGSDSKIRRLINQIEMQNW